MPRPRIPSWLSGLATPALEGVTDEQLLRRFHSDRDEVAFRVLLGRHGPMVLGVCRRILADEDDAEDAFQATFVVLARRCRHADREQLGPWLYEIARRTALKARILAQRRRGHERRAAYARVGIDQPHEPMADLRAALDDEIARLPSALRLAVIMCELQGLSRRQAATALGCPESTLFSRLAVARTQLAKRLSSRGITLSLAGLFGIVPPAMADRCIATVQTIIWRVETTAPTAILALSTEVLQAMSRTKKLSLVATLVVAFAACGSILTAAALADQEPIEVKSRGVGAKATSPNLDRFEFVAFDGFDGQLGLNWKVIRPDDSHVSLRTHPGKLTIRTQRGSIHAGGGIPPNGVDQESLRDR